MSRIVTRPARLSSRRQASTHLSGGIPACLGKVCRHTYDPAYGVPELGIEPGIPFETLPDDWDCPKCHAAKTEFEPQTGPMPGMVVPVGT